MIQPFLQIDKFKKRLYIDNLALIKNVKSTFLTADVAAAGETLTVKDITGFAIDKILFIGEPGREGSDIVKTHGATGPSGSTITLISGGVTHAHTQGTKVYIIDFDQVEFSNAATVAGSKTVIGSAIAIQADQKKTQVADGTNTTGYGFARWKETIGNTFSSYSDPVPYTGYDTNQVGYIIEHALKRNKTDFTDNVDVEFCVTEINECLKYIRGKLKKWHRLQDFDHILGQTSRGEYKFDLPDTMWDYSFKSVLQVHVQDGEALTYLDEREWNEELEGVIHTTNSGGASAGDTTFTIANSYDLSSSGTIMCAGQEITYTSKDNSTGILSGVPAAGTGSITATITDGAEVWQDDYEEGNPEHYTIKEGNLLIWPLVSSTYASRNVHIDFWKEAPEIDSPADTLDISRFDMTLDWLVWAIRSQLKNDGQRNDTDGDYKMFERKLNDAIWVEINSHGQRYKMKPKLNKIVR